MKRKSVSYVTVIIAILFFAAGLVLFPSDVSAAIQKALILLGKSVIPSLFPFFVVSRLFTSLRVTDIFRKFFKKIMPFFFSVSSSLATPLLLGLCGGYPIGAASVSELYRANLCSKKEAERALAFCNNSGPAFIIGVCGGVFKSARVGFFLFFIHFLSAISVGIIFRLFSPLDASSHKQIKTENIPQFSFAFTDSVCSAINSILSISAYIIFFSAFVAILRQTDILFFIGKILSKFLGLDPQALEALIIGLAEMTTGIFELTKCENYHLALVITSLIIGWGGFSVHAQTLNCISSNKLKTSQYFFGKLLQGILSAVYSALFLHFFKIKETTLEVFSPLHLTKNISSFSLFVPISLLLIYIFCKKGWKKSEE